jgi:hypothetical protein
MDKISQRKAINIVKKSKKKMKKSEIKKIIHSDKNMDGGFTNNFVYKQQVKSDREYQDEKNARYFGIAFSLGASLWLHTYNKVGKTFYPMMINVNFNKYIEQHVNLVTGSIKIEPGGLAIANQIVFSVCEKMMKEIQAFNSGVLKIINPFSRRELNIHSFLIIINKLYSREYSNMLMVKVEHLKPINTIGFGNELQNKKEENVFNIMMEVEILINENARIGGFDNSKDNGSIFTRPTKEAVQAFAFTIYILIEIIIQGSLQYVENHTITKDNIIKSVTSNEMLGESLIMMKLNKVLYQKSPINRKSPKK